MMSRLTQPDSRQQLHPDAPAQLPIADRRPSTGIIRVGLPVRPSLLRRGVIDQLEDMGRYAHLGVRGAMEQ